MVPLGLLDLAVRASHHTVYGIRLSAPIRRQCMVHNGMSTSVTAVCTAVCEELALVGRTGIKLYDLVIKTYLTCFLIHLDIVALVE